MISNDWSKSHPDLLINHFFAVQHPSGTCHEITTELHENAMIENLNCISLILIVYYFVLVNGLSLSCIFWFFMVDDMLCGSESCDECLVCVNRVRPRLMSPTRIWKV